MKWLYIMIYSALIIAMSACASENFEPIPAETAIISTVNIKDMTVSFFDDSRNKKLSDWQVNRPYLGGVILPDNDSLLLYGKTIDTVDVYSLSKGKKIDSWDTGEGIVNAIMILKGTKIAFADQTSDSIRIFSLEGKEIQQYSTEKEPLTMIEAKNEKKLYVISYASEHLNMISLLDEKSLPGFKIHSAAAGALLSEDQNELWIGGHGAGANIEEKIHVYDTRSGILKKEIAAPVMPVNFLRYNHHIFALSHGSNMLYKLSQNGEIQDQKKIGANPFDMEIFDGKLLVAGYDSNDIHIIDPESLQIERTVQVGKGPFQLVTRER